MKIRYYSDLHIEFGGFEIPPGGKDTILVLAGDIGVGLSAIPMIEQALQTFKAVIYVAGNHEFYGQDIYETIQRLREIDLDNFFFLENNSVIIDGVSFFGATLWTDLNKGKAKNEVNKYMNDYHMIHTKATEAYGWGGYRKYSLTPEDTIKKHKESLFYLIKFLDVTEGKKVVVTHHCPSAIMLNRKRYRRSDLDYAYYTPLEYLMDKPDVWICGHTHKTMDTQISNTRLLSNPRGYTGRDINEEFKDLAEITI